MNLLLVNVLAFQGFLAVFFSCTLAVCYQFLVVSSVSRLCSLMEVSSWTIKLFVNNGSNDTFECSGHEGGFSLYCCGSSPSVVIIVFFKKLLSPVFGSYSIKTVQKLLVCILQPREPLTGGADSVVVEKILVSLVDTLLRHCSLHPLKSTSLSNFGPVHEETPMNI